MPAITIHITERAYKALVLYAANHGRTVKSLAEAAVEDEIRMTPEYDDVLQPIPPSRTFDDAEPWEKEVGSGSVFERPF